MKYSLCICLLFFCQPLEAQNKVVFNIEFSSPNHTKVKLVSYDYVSNKSTFLENENIDLTPTRTKVVIPLKTPVYVSIFREFFFIEPGDVYSIKYNTENDSIIVSGKHAGNYLYWSLINKNRTYIGNFTGYNGKELILKQLLKNECARKISILDSLFKRNILSTSCYRYGYDEAYYSYLGSLLLIKPALPSIDQGSLKNILSEFTPERFVDEKKLHSKFYGFALYDYATNVLIKREPSEYSSSHLLRASNIIKKTFSGTQKEFLLSYLFRSYCRKQLPEYMGTIDSFYVLLKNELKIEKYRNVVLFWKEFYNKSNKLLPENILNTWIYTPAGDSVAFRSVIANVDKNYIDFWASWCSPCIKQIKEFVNKKEIISLTGNVIFISIDEDESKFTDFSNKLNIQSYRLSPFVADAFKKYFAIPPIPHTLMIEKNTIRDINFDFSTFINKF